MNKVFCILWALCFTSALFAADSFDFKENANLELKLSADNYNRLVIKDDKITQAFFPEGAMAVKNDDDGSLYVLVSNPNPFTLFVTTESGHHLSATIEGQAGLGKTVEFIPNQPAAAPKVKAVAKSNPDEKLATELLAQMIGGHIPKGFGVKHPFNQLKRFPNGLVETPKITYLGQELDGEVIELYNRSQKPMTLSESDFNTAGVRAISLSNNQLKPYEKGMLYVVKEKNHG